MSPMAPFWLEKGDVFAPARKVQVVISDAPNQFSDLKKVKVTFNTEEPLGTGYRLIIENSGGKADEGGFEIAP